MFDLDTISVHEIREQAGYPACAWRVAVSTDVEGRRGLGCIRLTPVAVAHRREVAVTILERGITSTRWRYYVDIVALARHGIDLDELLRSARGRRPPRGVTLEPVAPHLAGYGAVGQAKWAAWRRKEHLESACEENLDDQITLVASYLDPVFVKGRE